MSEHRELEVTLEAPRGWDLPDLAGRDDLREAGVAAAADLPAVELDALYLDTADLRLLRRGVTLRRRTGDDEPGWHLKLPAGDGSRTEIQRPLGSGEESPPALTALVTGLALGEPLVPVARLVTRRRVTELRDRAGAPLVAIARDEVAATGLGDREGDRGWAEIEAEAVEGDDALLGRVVEALVEAGATAASSRPKLARALALEEEPEPAIPDRPTAGDVVAAYLRAQVDELARRDPDVRRDLPDSVHRARVATRRLRAALASFGPLLDPDVTEPLRYELRWWGRVLGVARDAEVRRDRLAAAIDALPGALVVGPVREELVGGATTEYREAWRLATEKMAGPRYLALLRGLEALAADPPLTPRARRRADRELRRHVRRAWRRVDRRHAAAAAAPAAHRDELLHEARKAAKRARYAAEAVEPVFGHRARRLASRLDGVQEALGTQHDAIALADLLRSQARHAHEAGEPSFTYGVLAAGEHTRARHALDAQRDAWERASRPRVAGWTRRDRDGKGRGGGKG
ncbi:CYTH and CHAD domain-containing protein [Demequina rhizosphaerae]|uniref:CYTH and CHAD domain-containing protein n=1 Tax=Demequina rhizosphaerae TaxID=1638985 RepID=UPI00078173FE|nr:CYTH and CHAD domain-containing protein [Demequina rhizosphaerae]